MQRKKPTGKKPSFLAAYVLTASITKAAKAARLDRALHYRWLKDDEAYALAFSAATDQAAQTLEDEAVRRAHDGVEEPLVYQGEFSYKQRPVKDDAGAVVMVDGKPKLEAYGKPLSINKKSDTLLMFLLKGFRPDKFRDRVSAELSGLDGGPILLANAQLENLDDDELASLLLLARKLRPE